MQPQGGQTILLQTVPQGPTRYDRLHGKAVKVLGALQIAIGICCILFHIIAIIINAQLHPIGHGIWAGTLFVVSGSFGVIAGTQKTFCPIVTFMVLSIISACAAAPVISFSCIGLIVDHRLEYHYYISYDEYPAYYGAEKYKARLAMNGLLLGLAVFEGIIAIISASLCCRGVCGCRNNQQGAVLTGARQNVQYVTTGQPGASQPQVIIIQNPGQAQSGQQQLLPPQAGQIERPPSYNYQYEKAPLQQGI